jgi:hypothetical protein
MYPYYSRNGLYDKVPGKNEGCVEEGEQAGWGEVLRPDYVK